MISGMSWPGLILLSHSLGLSLLADSIPDSFLELLDRSWLKDSILSIRWRWCQCPSTILGSSIGAVCISCRRRRGPAILEVWEGLEARDQDIDGQSGVPHHREKEATWVREDVIQSITWRHSFIQIWLKFQGWNFFKSGRKVNLCAFYLICKVLQNGCMHFWVGAILGFGFLFKKINVNVFI